MNSVSSSCINISLQTVEHSSSSILTVQINFCYHNSLLNTLSVSLLKFCKQFSFLLQFLWYQFGEFLVLNQHLDFPLFSPLFFLILLGENLSWLLKGLTGVTNEKINSVIQITVWNHKWHQTGMRTRKWLIFQPLHFQVLISVHWILLPY